MTINKFVVLHSSERNVFKWCLEVIEMEVHFVRGANAPIRIAASAITRVYCGKSNSCETRRKMTWRKKEATKKNERRNSELWNTWSRWAFHYRDFFFGVGGRVGPLYTSMAKTIDNLMCPPTLSLASYQPTGQHK